MPIYPEFDGPISAINQASALYDEQEAIRRADLMRRARVGDFDALNYLRRGFHMKELVLDGRLMIHEGSVVGAKNQQRRAEA